MKNLKNIEKEVSEERTELTQRVTKLKRIIESLENRIDSVTDPAPLRISLKAYKDDLNFTFLKLRML